METKKCIVCEDTAKYRLSKAEIKYYQCTNCETLFCDELDNSKMVGGGFELERNTHQNADRIKRVMSLFNNNKYGINVLDFGCGHGMLVNDFREQGVTCDGYDKFNEEYQYLPKQPMYHGVTMIEVIEHTTHPFQELDVIHSILHRYGILYLETSFVDVAEEQRIELEDFFYINPQVGHSTIFSHYGLDILMRKKGFVPLEHINQNARIYQKQ